MRITLNISDDLHAEAKARAVRTHRRIGNVVDDALRNLFAGRGRADTNRRVVLPTDGGSGLPPGVDLEDKEQIAEVLGDNDPR